MLVRVTLSIICGSCPEEDYSHGHVDVRVKGEQNTEEAKDAARALVDTSFDEYPVNVDMEIISEEYEPGKYESIIIGGEGNALLHNPVGKTIARL